jgi:hypothetical protein
MRHISSAFSASATALLLALALTGCVANSGSPAGAEPSTTATPSIDPGPVALSKEAAALRYLDIVCANNISSKALNDAFAAGEEPYLSGSEPDATAVHAAATASVDNHRLAIEQLDDTYFTWPDLVAAQLPHVRSGYMSEMSTLSAMSTATSFKAAYNSLFPASTPEEKTAGQEIRYQLGISADTDATCAGHETGLTALAAEKLERDAGLTAQQ